MQCLQCLLRMLNVHSRATHQLSIEQLIYQTCSAMTLRTTMKYLHYCSYTTVHVMFCTVAWEAHDVHVLSWQVYFIIVQSIMVKPSGNIYNSCNGKRIVSRFNFGEQTSLASNIKDEAYSGINCCSGFERQWWVIACSHINKCRVWWSVLMIVNSHFRETK